MDDDEMAKIRSIGDQHEMEWNDALNLVTSAWWFKFLESNGEKGDEEGFHWFDEAMDVPAWLRARETCFLQQHLNEDYSTDVSHDANLPCLDIGEIEGMDGDWFA